MPSDHLNKAITSKLKPALAADGFFRWKPKQFVRIRGELVDVIAFQISQYGSKRFYVHYSCSLLANPEVNVPLTTYSVGARLSSPQDADSGWIGDTEEHAMSSIESFVSTYQVLLAPWYETIDNVRDWLVEYVASPNSSISSLDIAIALCLIRRENRAWWILCELIDRCDKDEVNSTWKGTLIQLQEAISENRHIELLTRWRNAVISKNKIERAAT